MQATHGNACWRRTREAAHRAQPSPAGTQARGRDDLSSAAAREEAELGWRRRVRPAGGLLLGRRGWAAAARANWGGN
jgi:hypothetical protein